jgi:hypothetical protein
MLSEDEMNLVGVLSLVGGVLVATAITTIVIHKKTQMPYIIAVPVSALTVCVGLGVISTIQNVISNITKVQNADNAIDRQMSPQIT